MRSSRDAKMHNGFCHVQDLSGKNICESLRDSYRYFARPELIHVIFAETQDHLNIFREWHNDLGNLQLICSHTFPYRVVPWWRRKWLIVSILNSDLFHFSVIASELGHELANQNYARTLKDGLIEAFPFSGPNFRVLSPVAGW